MRSTYNSIAITYFQERNISFTKMLFDTPLKHEWITSHNNYNWLSFFPYHKTNDLFHPANHKYWEIDYNDNTLICPIFLSDISQIIGHLSPKRTYFPSTFCSSAWVAILFTAIKRSPSVSFTSHYLSSEWKWSGGVKVRESIFLRLHYKEGEEAMSRSDIGLGAFVAVILLHGAHFLLTKNVPVFERYAPG